MLPRLFIWTMFWTSHKLVILAWGKMTRAVLFTSRWWQMLYFLIFPIFKSYIDIFLWFPIEPIHWRRPMISAKYHNIRLNIFNVGTLKTKDCQFDKFVIIGGTVSCDDNLRCYQWRQSCQIDDRLFSVDTFPLAMPFCPDFPYMNG